ncbi:sn-glycerol-3-phosphate import ATP-binding protein UgpC [Paludibacterium paludis]|uniref:Sn-glycerol-3-phosphate import ATP-binding protein UgpC n=1 Tax=Paludibacterium paludis TaxID=1225769 RepID=A0A918UBE1_9NEIS|nr:sn-glycerol-3-phosphate import ATP-binding protein UgpC [Paludibacterium paludis]GGY23045.1 sn-glycerol-3-phosphate import ATP-binding protein UgpC [Paludibacterium paludis]
MATLSLHHVGKSYPGAARAALESIDVEVADGEFVVIVGPSGCGKSTLLRMVAGLEAISEGEIRVGGRRVNELEPKDRDIAMVFQNYALYPHMSVADNMGYALKIRGMPKREIAERVGRVAAILELEPLLARKPRELSGGQRQRVAMGRAIVREPAVFLFDEPLSNLDARLRGQMRQEIQALHRRLRTTSLYVTHDQVEAMTLADRVILLDKGRIEQIGTPEAIYDSPASMFVAGFIGSPPMNLLPARIGADGRSLVSGAGRIALPEGCAPLAGRDVVFGIRPEHLRPDDHPDALILEVTSVEKLGADNHVFGMAGGHALTLKVPHHVAPEPGSRLPVMPDVRRLHVFDPVSQRRIADVRTASDPALAVS